MNDEITTPSANAKRQADSAFSEAPLRWSAVPSTASRTIDVLSFLLLIIFQCGAVIAIALYTPQIGEMGLVVFGIVFVWLGATLVVGLCDIVARPSR